MVGVDVMKKKKKKGKVLGLKYTSMKGDQKQRVKCLYHKAVRVCARVCGFVSFIQVAATTSKKATKKKMNQPLDGRRSTFITLLLEQASSVLLFPSVS